jgi:hypothetical protein
MIAVSRCAGDEQVLGHITAKSVRSRFGGRLLPSGGIAEPDEAATIRAVHAVRGIRISGGDAAPSGSLMVT